MNLEQCGEFNCSICLEFFSPPLALCNQCGASFHKLCIFSWINTNNQLAACPCCNATPLCVTENRALNRVFELAAEQTPHRCAYCKAGVTTAELLQNHYAICAAYQRHLLGVTSKRAEFVLNLLAKTVPQAAIAFSLPDHSQPWMRLQIPDRREKPQQLEFILSARRHKHDATIYRFDLCLAPEQLARFPLQLAAIIVYDEDKLDSTICLFKRKVETQLFRIVSQQAVFRLWICIF